MSNLWAIERIIKAIQITFELPTGAEVGQKH